MSTPTEDPLGYIEAPDYALMVDLGLRPHYWSTEGSKGSHPDQRPCPSWCWIDQSDEYAHEVNPSNPMVAEHSMGATPHVPASLYRGSVSPSQGDRSRMVAAATIEPRLEQQGQDSPTVHIGFRRCDADGQHVYSHDHLRLTLADTRDLIKALEYLADLAEKDAGYAAT